MQILEFKKQFFENRFKTKHLFLFNPKQQFWAEQKLKVNHSSNL